MDQNQEKKQAGEAAAMYVEDHSIVGLGTGSTVRYAIEKIAHRIKTENLQIQGIPTSKDTQQLAQERDIPLTSLDETASIDLTIDGVDEVDGRLDGIKGGGGALLWEKIVASASHTNIWVADAKKTTTTLGTFPLPIEVVPMAYPVIAAELRRQGYEPKQRINGERAFVSDGGHWIMDVTFGPIADAGALEKWLNLLPGVVECGLFLNRADRLLVGDGQEIREYERNHE